MSIKATHQALFSTRGDVVAWQFSPTADVPVWIVQNFHILDGNRNEWTDRQGNGHHTGEWAVMFPEDKVILCLTDEEFVRLFRPL